MSSIAAVVLAAGKGTRMKSKNVNKVALLLAKKPMVLHTVELLEKLDIKDIIVVVGFAKESVISLLGKRVKYAEQKKRLGTAHAVSVALKELKKPVSDILPSLCDRFATAVIAQIISVVSAFINGSFELFQSRCLVKFINSNSSLSANDDYVLRKIFYSLIIGWL